MMRSLLTRILYEKRWFVVGWSLVFGVMSTLILMFYPSFSSNDGFEKISKELPSQLQGFIGDPDMYRSLDGFIALQVFDVRMSLLLIIMSLVLATNLTVRDEESGDLRTTLMTSLGRSGVLMQKFIAAAAMIAIICMVAIAGIYIGIFALSESAPHALLWKLFALSVLFGIASFSIPFSIGLATGKRSYTMFIGLFVAVGSYILTTFARSVEWLQDIELLSLMHYYDTAGVRNGTLELWNIWVLVLVPTVTITVALLVFRRRDIA